MPTVWTGPEKAPSSSSTGSESSNDSSEVAVDEDDGADQASADKSSSASSSSNSSSASSDGHPGPSTASAHAATPAGATKNQLVAIQKRADAKKNLKGAIAWLETQIDKKLPWPALVAGLTLRKPILEAALAEWRDLA